MNKPKILTAIFVTGKGTSTEHWYKYRKISSSEYSLKKFIIFAKSKGANEVNLYDQKTALFWQKIRLVDR